MPTLSQAQEACSLIGRAQLAAREAMIAGQLSQALWWTHEVKAEADNGRDILRALIEQGKAVGDGGEVRDSNGG
jgi:hypothetical protein